MIRSGGRRSRDRAARGPSCADSGRRGAAARAAAVRARGAQVRGRARDAEPEVRGPGAPVPPSPAVHGRRPPLGDRRDAVPRPPPADPDRPRRPDPFRPLRLARPRHQDPLPRGQRRDRAEDGARPGVHHLGLPAGRDRPAVRDRRPGHVHRLRPHRDRPGDADPPAGDLQARRRRRLERLDRLRRPDPPRRHRRRQRDHRRQRRRHPRHPGQCRRRRNPRPGRADAPRPRASELARPGRARGLRSLGPARTGPGSPAQTRRSSVSAVRGSWRADRSPSPSGSTSAACSWCASAASRS